MAAAVLQAGDKRSMAVHASMLIHDGATIIEGYNRSTVKSWLTHSQTTDKWYEDILFDRMRAKDTQFSRKNLQRWLSHDTILLPDRALELGLIDEIIEG
jgi:ATP-dependent protease ClpP protease subunit